MTRLSRFMPTTPAAVRAVAYVFLVFSIIFATDLAFSQPPRGFQDRSGAAGNDPRAQGNRNNRGGRGDRSDRGGRNARPDGQVGGFPGGNQGQPGGFPGGNQGQPGGFPGANQGQPNGQPGGNPGDEEKKERVIDLDSALDNTIGTVPIVLNQDNFRTSDNVKLRGTYYKGKGDQDTPVVIIVPGIGDKPDSYSFLAQTLAMKGIGVLLPELRQSRAPTGPNNRNNNPPNDAMQNKGQQGPVEPSAQDVRAMINADRAVWFNFLLYLNHKRLCNIKKTIVVGSEFGAALACAWAKADWSSKDEYSQNIVGLALISPDAEDKSDKKSSKKKETESTKAPVKTYDCLASLEDIRKSAKGSLFGYYVFVGSNNSAKLESAKLIQSKLGGAKDADEKPENKTVPVIGVPTNFQGAELLALESANIPAQIVNFVQKRMKELPKKRDRWEDIGEWNDDTDSKNSRRR